MEEIKLSKAQRRVFDYMTEFGSITSLQAFTDLGETRLSAVIFDLKKKGVVVMAENIKVKNRFGEARTVSKYTIGGRI